MCWRTRRQSKVWYSLHTAACNHFAAAAAALAAAAAAEANCFSVVVVVVVVVVVEVVTNPSSLARSPLLRAGSADMVFCIIIYIYMYILSIYIYTARCLGTWSWRSANNLPWNIAGLHVTCRSRCHGQRTPRSHAAFWPPWQSQWGAAWNPPSLPAERAKMNKQNYE